MLQSPFDLEDQGQGSSGFDLLQDLYVIKTRFKFEGKIPNLSCSQGITRTTTQMMTEAKQCVMCLPPHQLGGGDNLDVK